MRQIINGLRYDTDTAEHIGEASFGNRGDFTHWSAGLYKAPRSGRFFLAGAGGPRTQWVKSCGQNSWTGSQGIIALTVEGAREWAEQHLSADAVEAAFGDQVQDA